jgi:hypothetical protein
MISGFDACCNRSLSKLVSRPTGRGCERGEEGKDRRKGLAGVVRKRASLRPERRLISAPGVPC